MDELKQAQALYDTLVEFAVTYSFQIVGAIIIFLIGWWVAVSYTHLTLPTILLV